MFLNDAFGYLVFGNPISQALITTAATVTQGLTPRKLPVISKQLPLWEIAGRSYNFVRVAGLSGATAVIMGAYGKHSLANIADPKEQAEAKAIFETANRFHFLHSFALFAMPLSRRPLLTGSLMTAGTMLFSGTMYYRALTGDKTFVSIATCGGFILIAAWLTLVF